MLHLLRRQARAIQHHSERVAIVGAVGEHIDLLEGALFHGFSFKRQEDRARPSWLRVRAKAHTSARCGQRQEL